MRTAIWSITAALPIAAMLLTSGDALAQRRGWGSSERQGAFEAGVDANRSRIIFSCPEQYPGQRTGFSVDAQGRLPPGRHELRLIVAQQTFAFEFETIASTSPSVYATVSPENDATETRVKAAVDALLGTTATTFAVEIPEMNWRQEFPLTNVKSAMRGGPGRSRMSKCKPSLG